MRVGIDRSTISECVGRSRGVWSSIENSVVLNFLVHHVHVKTNEIFYIAPNFCCGPDTLLKCHLDEWGMMLNFDL